MSLAASRNTRRSEVAGCWGLCQCTTGAGEEGTGKGAKRPRAVDTREGPKGRKDRPTQYFLLAPRYMLPGQTLCRLWYLSGKFSPQAHLSSRRGELSRRGSQPRGEPVTARTAPKERGWVGGKRSFQGSLRRATKSSPTALSRWPIQLRVAIHFIKLRFKGHKRRRESYRTHEQVFKAALWSNFRKYNRRQLTDFVPSRLYHFSVSRQTHCRSTCRSIICERLLNFHSFRRNDLKLKRRWYNDEEEGKREFRASRTSAKVQALFFYGFGNRRCMYI